MGKAGALDVTVLTQNSCVLSCLREQTLAVLRQEFNFALPWEVSMEAPWVGSRPSKGLWPQDIHLLPHMGRTKITASHISCFALLPPSLQTSLDHRELLLYVRARMSIHCPSLLVKSLQQSQKMRQLGYILNSWENFLVKKSQKRIVGKKRYYISQIFIYLVFLFLKKD